MRDISVPKRHGEAVGCPIGSLLAAGAVGAVLEWAARLPPL